MPLHADTSDAPRFVRITLSGDWPSFDERAAFRRQLVTDGHMQARTRALIDLRDLKTLPAHGDVDAIVTTAQREGALPRLHAYLAATADQVALARLFKQSTGAGTVVEIFKDLQEAETWLWNAEPGW